MKLANGSQLPEFLHFEQSTMTLKYGSKMAVDLFGIQNLYSIYTLDWIGVTSSGQTAKLTFTLKFTNTEKKWTQLEEMGILSAQQYQDSLAFTGNIEPFN